jgi:hypothetical protein
MTTEYRNRDGGMRPQRVEEQEFVHLAHSFLSVWSELSKTGRKGIDSLRFEPIDPSSGSTNCKTWEREEAQTHGGLGALTEHGWNGVYDYLSKYSQAMKFITLLSPTVRMLCT